MAPGLAHGFSNLNSDQVTVTGEAVQFPDYPASEIIVTALKTNMDPIYIGPSGVSDSTGLEVIPGASVTLHVGHTAMLWAIGNSGDKISFVAAY
jgi:hypothetical protein